MNLRHFILCIILTITSHHAIGKSKTRKVLKVGVGLLINEIDTKQSHTKISFNESKLNFLASTSIQAPIEPWLFLEMNINYGRFQFVRIFNNQILSETVNRFHIPLVIRLSPLSFLSFGGGFYGSYRVGGVQGVQTSLLESELTSAHDSGEHGLEGMVGFNFPTLWQGYSVGVDFRTMFSLTERSGESRSWQNFLIMVRKDLL